MMPEQSSGASRPRLDPAAAIDNLSKTSIKGTRRVQVDFWRPQKPELGTGNFGILRKLRAAVLLVEDTATNRMVAEDLLTRWGCRHRSAVDGLEALGAIETGRFDAVLMDVTMPGMSGYEVARRVRRGRSENRDVPIIALTAHTGEEAREKAREAGMTAFATKPVDSRELAALLARVLARDGDGGVALQDGEPGVAPAAAGSSHTALSRAPRDHPPHLILFFAQSTRWGTL